MARLPAVCVAVSSWSATLAALAGLAVSAWAQPAPTPRLERASRVRVEGLADQLPNVRITDFEGREVASQVEPQREGTAVSILARREPLLIKPRQIERLEPEAGKRLVLPGGMVLPAERPDGSMAEQAGWYRLTFEASPLPAPWNAEGQVYVTRLLFGLRRPPELPVQLPEGRQVVVRLAFDGLAADEPPPLVLEAAGLEHEKAVDLRFRVLTDEPRILVRSTFSDVDLVVRALPRLEVRPQQRRVLGLGLEAIPVTVASVFAHGQARPIARETPLAVEIDGPARAESVAARLATGESASTFTLRSGGLGPVHLAVTADGLTGNATVVQRFPWGPLLAALLGGALGGYARRFIKGARRHLTVRRITEGMVVGLVAFVAGVLGVGYLQLPAALVATEAGAFLTAALAGFAGVSLIERLGGPRVAAA